MPEVSLKIGSKTYNVRCGEGEQDKIAALGDLIAEKYAQLGKARTPLESTNLLFSSLFMADELYEARSIVDAASDATKACEAELQKSNSQIAHEKTKSGGKKAELRAEIETLRKSETRAREEVAKLKAELADLREASQQQQDLFGAPLDEETVAALLETLADKAEASADAMEGAVVCVPEAKPLEDAGDKS